MEAARPTHTVLTSGRTCRMVSNTAIPAVTEPPGEFTYMVMSCFGEAASRYSSCACSVKPPHPPRYQMLPDSNQKQMAAVNANGNSLRPQNGSALGAQECKK